MKDHELREQGPPDKFDNTMISSYVTCPRKEYWFLRRLAPEITPPYFTFGRAFGQGINMWHTLQGQGHSQELREAMAIKVAEEIWNKEQPVENGNDNYSNLESMIKNYCRLYPEEELWETVATEIGFTLPIPGTSVFYAGSLDSYIRWPGYGLLLREDKTTGAYITPNFLEQWTFSSQVTGYIWALWQVIGEEPFGALMNIASKRPRKDPVLGFSRDLQKRSDFRTQRFMEETVAIIDQIRSEWDSWTWPKIGERNPMNCAGGMGRSKCEYAKLCKEDIDPWDLDERVSYSGMGFKELPPWAPWEREGDDD